MLNTTGRLTFAVHAALAAILAVITLPGLLPAQDATGRIIGTVTDSQGAVIGGAGVNVTNAQTLVETKTTTDAEGRYQVLFVPIGTYRVTAEHTGFRRTVVEGQTLQINQSLRVDMKLEVGAVTETVSVQSETTGVETVTATLGGSVTNRPIVDMPLNGRNVLSLALMMPGVTESRPGSPGAYSISGGRPDSITYLFDGGLNNNLLNNRAVLNPNPDAIQEFRILTSNYTAEYGRNGGGIISVVSKSGANDFHGVVYDYLRNEDLNANLFFNNRDGLPKPILKRNQFGATVGGPILLPKFNGRNKAFFLVSYQGQRLAAAARNAQVITFTPGELNGDFSRTSGGRPDAGVASFLQKNPYFQPNPGMAAQGIMDPSRINSIAKKYIAGNLIPTSADGRLFPQASSKGDHDELTEKVDLNLSDKDRFTLTLGSKRSPAITPFSFGTSPAGYPITGNTRTYLGSITYNKVFTPQLINEFRFTAQRNNGLQSVPGAKLPTAAELGIGTTPDNPTGPPIVSFGTDMTIGFSPQGPTKLVDNTYAFTDTVTWIRGRHNWKFGASWSPYQDNTVYDFYVNGQFYFSGPTGAGGIGSGNPRADFLFGLPDEYLQFGEAPSDIRSKTTSFFLQDEWRLSKRLILTLGMRYDYSQPKIDTRGRSFSLKYGQQSTMFTKAPVGLQFPGDPGAPNGANQPDKNDFAPRFGFAYDPTGNGKWSIRGGIGMFYDILKGEDNLQFNGQAPFFGFADLYFDPYDTAIPGEVPMLSRPFQTAGIPNSFPSRPPAKNIDFDASGFLPFGGGGVYFVDPNLRTPYIYHYNLSVQRELFASTTAEFNYVGSSAHKLTGLTDANPVVRGQRVRLFSTQPGAKNSNSLFSYLDEFRNVANANYNSLQANITKRPSRSGWLGYTYFTLGYTYAHSIDNSSGFRERGSRVPYYNWRQFRANSDHDIHQRLVFSGYWNLPLEKTWQRGPQRLTKGWSLGPILTWRTGFPMDVFSGISRSRTRVGPSGAGDPNLVRADLVGSGVTIFDPKRSQVFRNRTGNYWYDPANLSSARFTTAFESSVVANPSLATYGTLGRNAFRSPGRTNLDLALYKTTDVIGEKLKLQFRAEFFNLLNHAQFQFPNNSITSGTFGQITTTEDPRIIQFALRLEF